MKSLKIVLFTFISCYFSAPAFSQKSKDGNKTIISANTIVNEFTPVISNTIAGNNTVDVADVSLNSNGRFNGPLVPGDLIMIIQMQGASITGNVNDSTWGTIISYNNCGLYEFQEVLEIVSSNTIKLTCPLENSYTAGGKVQVIRVPRYSSLEILNGGVLTTMAWNGSTGGVMVAEINGPTVIQNGGSINVTGLGFRGGDINNTSTIPGTGIYASVNVADGGEKGESIAGYQGDYNVAGGRFSRGAPANGGGGGNAHNTGGGGGANAGALLNYNGDGNPDNANPGWTGAWNLEYNGFANSTSTGGGKGGYSFALNNEDASVIGPGNNLWGGDERENRGGKGGRPLDYSNGRLFLGGGGGSGDANDDNAGSSGAGGGLAYLLSFGIISGSGEIVANGLAGTNTTGIGRDAASGGGGGGTVILNTTATIIGISIKANGGNGGNQVFNNPINPFESEGPGGGGGGGYIAISKGNILRIATGGNNGVTNSAGVTEFPANGATGGGEGFANERILRSFGCPDTTEKPVEPEPEPEPEPAPKPKPEPEKAQPIFTFYVPNSFSPDNDGINDFFYGSGIGIVDYEMWIFDRWGMNIFYSNDIDLTWNGRIQKTNEIAKQDVYVWVIKLKDVFGKDHEYRGNVTLLR